ncbi:hypothetical protein KSP40_PGU015203 [Platanthera guangdongensis]|uniref:Senescence regulator n=1 Tax=Platanthera guangdongensis TaxID=2320717 RepID=A0ABR2MAG4_9ASPA
MEEDFDEEEVWPVIMESGDDSPKTGKPNALGEEKSAAAVIRQSAPVNIPNWAKIYKKGEKDDGFEEEDEDEEEDRVPPHVWIAKKMARSQISSFSVCEGAGRTLKGRDQRNVRDEVLTRTGFLE